MKKILWEMAIAILIIAYTARVYTVNKSAVRTVPVKYDLGVEVPLENDFFDSSDENANGYTVTVLDTSLITVDEFLKLYGESDAVNYDALEYMYLVNIRFRNVSNRYGENAGINLSRYILQDNSYISYMNTDAYHEINNVELSSFSLKLGTEEELIVPFGIDTEYIDAKRIKDNMPELVVSTYPHKKSIRLST